MENLPSYSNYVLAAYSLALIAIVAFSAIAMWRYFSLKSLVKNLKKDGK